MSHRHVLCRPPLTDQRLRDQTGHTPHASVRRLKWHTPPEFP